MKKRQTLTKSTAILMGIAAVLVLFVIMDRVIIPSLSKGGIITQEKAVKLSKDQKKIVDKIGYPDVFVLMIENDERREIWTYFDTGINCIFSNGKIAGFKEQYHLTENFHYPSVKPTQFSNGMMEKDVIRILSQPSAVTEGNIETIDGTVKILDYFDQVRVGMVEGQVVYVQTLPFALR